MVANDADYRPIATYSSRFTRWIIRPARPGVLLYLHARFVLAPAICFVEASGPLACLTRTYRVGRRRTGGLVLAYLFSLWAASLLAWLVARVGPLLSLLFLEVDWLRAASLVVLLVFRCGLCCILPLTTMFVAYGRIRDWEISSEAPLKPTTG